MNKKLPKDIVCFVSDWSEFESHNGRYYDMCSVLIDLEKCGHIAFKDKGYTYDHVYDKGNTETYDDVEMN